MDKQNNTQINYSSSIINTGSYPNRSRREKLLLKIVKLEVQSRLESLLHYSIFNYSIGQKQSKKINSLCELEIRTDSATKLLPPRMSVLEVFEQVDVAGKLLIVGKAGSGKTTIMLELAQEMIQKAEIDSTYPIPIIFDISSRNDSSQPILDWLIDDLKFKYGIDKKIGKNLFTQFRLLPLLDSLDEVNIGTVGSHALAINQWLSSSACPPRLAICSQWEEFEDVVQDQWERNVWQSGKLVRLPLQGTLLLKPLANEHIQFYLNSLECSDIWLFIQQNANLLEIIRVPFWLNIVIICKDKLDLEQFQQLTLKSQQLELLLNIYVEEMLHQEVHNQSYLRFKSFNVEQIKCCIAGIAKQMQTQKEFTSNELKFYQFMSFQKVLYEHIVNFLILLTLVAKPINIYSKLFRYLSDFVLITIGAIILYFLGEKKWELSKWPFYLIKLPLVPLLLIITLIFNPLNFIAWSFLFYFLIFSIPSIFMLFDRKISQLISLLGYGQVDGLPTLFLGLITFLFKGNFIQFNYLLLLALFCIFVGWTSFIFLLKHTSNRNHITFLEFCTDCHLLHKVGQRYRFAHQILWEYFAIINC